MGWAPTGGHQVRGREVSATREQPAGVSCRGASPWVPPAVLQERSAEVQSAPLAVLPGEAEGQLWAWGGTEQEQFFVRRGIGYLVQLLGIKPKIKRQEELIT